MPHTKRRTVSFDCLATIVTLWAAALALVVADMAGAPAEAGRLGLLMGMAAATSTVVRVLMRTQRVGLQLLAYEGRRTREAMAIPTQRARHLRGV